jgi:DNA-binding NarL/FixJ family response regulator
MVASDRSTSRRVAPTKRSTRREIRVVVAAQDRPTRTGIREALTRAGLSVVAEVVDGAAALDVAIRESPDVCVIDSEPLSDVLNDLERLAVHVPRTSVVVISGEPNVDELIRVVDAGVSGYLPRDVSAEALGRAVRGVASGEAALPRALMRNVLEKFRAPTQGQRLQMLLAERGMELTQRECQVLDLLSQHLSTAEVAQRLSIAPTTVRRHIHDLQRKLGVSDREVAVRLLNEALRNERPI